MSADAAIAFPQSGARPRPDERLRAAVIGVGVMGWNHARVLAATPDIDLVGVCDPDPARRNHAGEAFRCAAFAELDDALAAGLDVAVVSAPNNLHRSIGCGLMENGVHVLMEKPIASTVADARALIETAEACDRRFMIGHIERFNPAVRAAAEACREDEIISINIARVGPFPARMSDVGVVIDLGVHDIDLIQMIAGSPIVDASAQLSSVHGGREDSALMQFRTENGVAAHINTNWITPYKARTLQIATAKKYVVADLMNRQVVEHFDYRPDASYATRHLSVPMVDALRAEIEEFADAVREDRAPAITGMEGLRNLEVALACLENAAAPARRF